MSKISTLCGEVIDGTPVLHHSKEGEDFYKIRVKFKGTELDVVFSQYIKEESYSGKISVVGFLASFTKRDLLPEFFLFANSITPVDWDTETTNEIEFSYKVTRISKLNVNKKGVDVLTLYASDYSPLHQTSVIYLYVKGRLARELSTKPAGFYINGTGYIKPFKDVYEVIVKDVPADGIQYP